MSPTDAPPRPAGRRARVRGLLLALVIGVELVSALPIPHSVHKKDLSEEKVATEEIEAQRALLARIGIQVTHQQMVDVLYASASAWATGYTTVMDPLGPVFRVLGIGQSWGLFTYPDTFPHQLVVDVRRSKTGPWERWYAGLDDAHAWSRDILTYRRIRGVYDGQTTHPGASWNNLTKWLAARACAEDSEVRYVRVAFRRFHTVAPGHDPDPTAEEDLQARLWARAQVMP